MRAVQRLQRSGVGVGPERAGASLGTAVEAFRTHAVRRLAVVDIARDLRALTSPLAAEIGDPQRDSPVPVTAT